VALEVVLPEDFLELVLTVLPLDDFGAAA